MERWFHVPTGLRRLRATAGSVCSMLPLTAVLGMMPACIDTNGRTREQSVYWFDGVDPGSVPADCSEDDGLEFLILENFELGASPGIFTNNEICNECQEYDAALAEAEAALNGAPLDDPEQLEALTAARDEAEEDLQACVARCRASQDPTDFDKPLPADEVPNGRCGSRYSLHITAGPFENWGGVVGFPLPAPRAPDVSPEEEPRAVDYEGLAFWARTHPYRRQILRVNLVDPATDSTLTEEEGRRCNPEVDLDNYQESCDPYGSYAQLNQDWHLILLPYREMRQAGSGVPSPALDLENVRQLSMMYPQGSWDFWIDDVGFYRRTSEPGEPSEGGED